MKPGTIPNAPVDPGTAPTPEIPDKIFFRIGEVAQLAGVEPYVIRFWETEFPQLAPRKSGTGHRIYKRKEVEMVLEVKRLLYEKRFTIEGARLYLGQSRRRNKAAVKQMAQTGAQAALFPPSQSALQAIREELRAILDMLK